MKNARPQSVDSEARLDEDGRKHILYEVWVRKVWIGILLVLFPVGAVDGLAHRAWLPTLSGAAVSLLFIWVAARDIKQRRRLLNLSR